MTIQPAQTDQVINTKSKYLQAIDACHAGQLSLAIQHAHEAIEKGPQAFEACILIGKLHQTKRDFDQAKTYYKQASELQPDSAVTDHYFGSCHADSGMTNTAIHYFLSALEKQPDLLITRQLLAATLGKMQYLNNALFSKQMEKELLRCFQDHRINHRSLFAISLAILRSRPDFHTWRELVLTQNEQALSKNYSELLSSPLLLNLLQKIFNYDIHFEPLLRALRQLLLQAFLNSIHKAQPLSEFASTLIYAMAAQSFLNEYIWSISATEKEQLEELGTHIQRLLSSSNHPSQQLLDALFTGVMYQSPESFQEAVALDWSLFTVKNKTLKNALEQCILNDKQEQRLVQQLKSIAPITQSTSLIVQQQYETYPYPRWLSFDQKKPLPFVQWVKENFSHAQQVSKIAQLPPEVLIAGCGTGNHAITSANQYADADVLAIDLSRRSLGYASRMATKYEVNHLNFAQGDLLEIGVLDKKFSVIECSGTLHHMADPFAGWKALRDVLRPGGIMKIGLYSQTARRKLPHLREMARQQKVGRDREKMQHFRDYMIKQADDDNAQIVINIADFYTYNAFQDLLFHPQEHCFTIPQIADHLQRLELQFLGFTLEAPQIQAYRDAFPDTDVFDLNAWDQFEKQQPDTFIMMYQFWCQYCPVDERKN